MRKKPLPPFSRATSVRALVASTFVRVSIPTAAALVALGLGCQGRATQTIGEDPAGAPAPRTPAAIETPASTTAPEPTTKAGGSEIPDVPIAIPAKGVKVPVKPAAVPMSPKRPPPIPPTPVPIDIEGGLKATRLPKMGPTRIA